MTCEGRGAGIPRWGAGQRRDKSHNIGAYYTRDASRRRWGRRGDDGGGGPQLVHGRSRTTIYPCISTVRPGRSTSGFHQPGIHCLHQARSAVSCSASRMKGDLHPSKNRSHDGLRYFVHPFLFMDDSTNELLSLLVWPLQRQQWLLLLCNGSVGALPYSHYVLRAFPLCGVRLLHSAH